MEEKSIPEGKDEGGALEVIWEVMWLDGLCYNVGWDGKAKDLNHIAAHSDMP